jgi:hypothetical protein
VAGFVVALMAAFIFREHLNRLRFGRQIAALALIAGIGLAGITCNEEELPTEVPWKNAEVQQYKNPAMATQGLLHGIIADGIINVGSPIAELANIQAEVGLPTNSPTAGQAYALKTFGLDGWGQEFRLTKQADGKYEVRSGGADGTFDNADDLSIEVNQTSNSDWDSDRYAFFVRKVGGKTNLFYHRWSGDHFEYHNEELAQTATGTKLFDLFTQETLEQRPEQWLAPVEACYNEFAATQEPLVMILLGPGNA